MTENDVFQKCRSCRYFSPDTMEQRCLHDPETFDSKKCPHPENPIDELRDYAIAHFSGFAQANLLQIANTIEAEWKELNAQVQHDKKEIETLVGQIYELEDKLGKIREWQSLLEKYKKLLKEEADRKDIEVAHIAADKILCDLLVELGFREIVDIYKLIPKEYT